MGTQLPPQKGTQQPPAFRPMSIVAKRSPSSAAAELLFHAVSEVNTKESMGQATFRTPIPLPNPWTSLDADSKAYHHVRTGSRGAKFDSINSAVAALHLREIIGFKGDMQRFFTKLIQK